MLTISLTGIFHCLGMTTRVGGVPLEITKYKFQFNSEIFIRIYGRSSIPVLQRQATRITVRNLIIFYYNKIFYVPLSWRERGIKSFLESVSFPFSLNWRHFFISSVNLPYGKTTSFSPFVLISIFIVSKALLHK